MLFQSPGVHRFCIILLLILISGISLSAADTPERGWTLGPSVGVHWGTAYEIVYDTGDPSNTNPYLSLLTWDLQPALTVGIESRWESGKKGGLDLMFRTAIPGMPVGEMWDYDWLTANDSTPTYWSVSDVWLRWGFIIDAGYDWNLISAGFFTFNVGVGYHLDWWAWRDITKDSSYGLIIGVSGIDYSVAYNVPLVKIVTNFEGKTFFLNISGRIGPVIAFSHDHHKLRTETLYPPSGPENVDGLHFHDSSFGGPWLDLSIIGGFHTDGNFSFSVKGEYAWLKETRGNTVVVYSDGITPSSIMFGAAGFSFRRIGVTALCSWTLGSS